MRQERPQGNERTRTWLIISTDLVNNPSQICLQLLCLERPDPGHGTEPSICPGQNQDLRENLRHRSGDRSNGRSSTADVCKAQTEPRPDLRQVQDQIQGCNKQQTCKWKVLLVVMSKLQMQVFFLRSSECKSGNACCPFPSTGFAYVSQTWKSGSSAECRVS